MKTFPQVLIAYLIIAMEENLVCLKKEDRVKNVYTELIWFWKKKKKEERFYENFIVVQSVHTRFSTRISDTLYFRLRNVSHSVVINISSLESSNKSQLYETVYYWWTKRGGYYYFIKNKRSTISRKKQATAKRQSRMRVCNIGRSKCARRDADGTIIHVIKAALWSSV